MFTHKCLKVCLHMYTYHDYLKVLAEIISVSDLLTTLKPKDKTSCVYRQNYPGVYSDLICRKDS